MNYELVVAILVSIFALYFGVKYLKPYIEDRINIDLAKKLTEELYDIAKLIGDDEQDVVIDKIYDILLDTYDYIDETILKDNLSIEETKEYVEMLLSEIDINITENERKLIGKAIDIIVNFINQ